MKNFLMSFSDQGQTEGIKASLNNFWKRLKGIVVSPSKTMEELEGKPNLLLPIIMIVVVVIATLLLNNGPFKEYSKKVLMESNIKANVQMTAEKINQEINNNANVRLAIIPVIALFTWVTGTLILFLLIKLFKGKGTIKQFLTITGYAYIIIIFSGILESLIVLITGNYNRDFTVTSLGFILPTSFKGNFFYGMSRGIELFTIWNYYVVGIGVCYISKLSKTKVYIIIGAMFILPILFGGLGEVLSTMVKK